MHAPNIARCAALPTRSATTREAGPTELDEVRSARMRANLMRTIRQDAAARDLVPRRPAAPRRQPWVAYLAIAASLVVALLSAVNNAALRAERDVDRERIARSQQSSPQAKSTSELRIA